MARRKLKTGFTTGTSAAGAAKAAVLLAFGSKLEKVEVSLPEGVKTLSIPVAWSRRTADGCWEAVVIKDAGDDPDVTNKAKIKAEVELFPGAAQSSPPGNMRRQWGGPGDQGGLAGGAGGVGH